LNLAYIKAYRATHIGGKLKNQRKGFSAHSLVHGSISRRNKALVLVSSTLLVALVVSGCAAQVSEEATVPEVEMTALENGVMAPVTPQNVLHGWSTDENQLLRFETCDEWDYWWVYEGPAVSTVAAADSGFPGMTISTEHYIKNQHLDEDKDGVLCFFENREKPTPESGSMQWLKAFDAVWNSLESGQSNEENLDFAASPNALPEDTKIIRDGVEMALGAWSPFLNLDKPLFVTVVHPDDKDWFIDRWESLGKGGVHDGWFDDVSTTGGGAAGRNPDGSIIMYFMTGEEFTPPAGALDFYYHEVTHVFESQWNAPPQGPISCWTVEGPASFIGFSKSDPSNREVSSAVLAAMRVDRADFLARYFEANGGLTEENLQEAVLNGMNSDDGCQFGAPYFGYTLGMFVVEKLLIDFGMEGFVALNEQEVQVSKSVLQGSFKQALNTDYEEWVSKNLTPYLLSEFKAITLR
jgi:hypothetical protein